MDQETLLQVRAYVDYLRDLGIYDLYRTAEAGSLVLPGVSQPAEPPREVRPAGARATPVLPVETKRPEGASRPTPGVRDAEPLVSSATVPVAEREESIPKPIAFDDLVPLPEVRVGAAVRPAALHAIRERIGDCTRCPLAYAGRHTIVFGDGDPAATLMFVGEGPGADEDTSGVPFVGKAGQLLNNMIGAMGLKREQVYIANIVKCRPPGNRVPEPVEANTCSQFLLEQIDVVQPRVIVALGSTAATYLLGVRQSLSSLRGAWHSCRGAKVAVTYHPAYLLRDPRQKGEAWKDLQRVMGELGLKSPARG